MLNKIPLSCNLRFNIKNKSHMKAAELLSMVGSRYKTAFVALAVEAYLKAHPTGIDMNELRDIQMDTWRKEKSEPKENRMRIINNLIPVAAEPTVPEISTQEPDESREAAKNALSYYNI